MRRKVFYCLIVLFVLFNAAVALRLMTRKATADVDDTGYANLTVYARALQLIRQGYVDAAQDAVLPFAGAGHSDNLAVVGKSLQASPKV